MQILRYFPSELKLTAPLQPYYPCLVLSKITIASFSVINRKKTHYFILQFNYAS